MSRGLAQNTLDAYRRALDHYLDYLAVHHTSYETVSRAEIGTFVRELLGPPRELASASVQLVLTVVRLFHGYLVEEGMRPQTPISRGDARTRGFAPHQHSLPWIPTEDQWLAIVNAAKSDSTRNRVMLALGYDAGLRREELCGLTTADIDPSHRVLRVRADHAKGRRERMVPYTPAASSLYVEYLRGRRSIGSRRDGLFLLNPGGIAVSPFRSGPGRKQ